MTEFERRAAEIEVQERTVEAAEEHLKEESQTLLNMQLGLAKLMNEEGVSKFVTTDGLEVSIKDEFRVTFPKDRGPAVRWLEESGHGNILKNQVSVNLGRGIDVSPLKDAIRALGFAFEEKADCPWQTLSKFSKELLEEGADFNREVFNVFEQTVAKVKRAKV